MATPVIPILDKNAFPFPEWKEKNKLIADSMYQYYISSWEIPKQALLPHIHETWNPCPNPVTLDELNLPIILNYPYIVAEKTDGVRLQFLFVNGYVAAFDRSGTCFKIPYPLPSNMISMAVLDGELVIDEKNPNKYYYVVFDCIFINNRCQVQEKDYLKRMGRAARFIKETLPFQTWNPIAGQALEFEFTIKTIRNLKERTIDEIMNTVRPYKSDGLVFTPRVFSIPLETSPFLLKWKELEDQTLDFRLVGHPPLNNSRLKWGIELTFRFHDDERNIFQGFWFAGYKIQKIRCLDSDLLQSILQEWEDDVALKKKNGESVPIKYSKIVEVKIDSLDLEKEQMMLKVIRERKDKSSPNSELTIIGTLKTLLFMLDLFSMKKTIYQTLKYKKRVLEKHSSSSSSSSSFSSFPLLTTPVPI